MLRRAALACSVLFTLSLLLAPELARSDAPLPVAEKYTKCSASGKLCFTSDPDGGFTWGHPQGKPEPPTWVLPGWFRVAFLADDGEHLVTGYDGGNLVPREVPETITVVSFWYQRRLLKSYTLDDLGYTKSKLQETASHYAWGSYEGFGADGRFRLRMIDDKVLAFDVATGELVP